MQGLHRPSSTNPKTKRPYGLDFPIITIRDMVRAQKKLIEHLGISRLFCVTGGSMGGMQALEWAVSYPDSVRSAIAVATAAKQYPVGIVFHDIGRKAILTDRTGRTGTTTGGGSLGGACRLPGR